MAAMWGYAAEASLHALRIILAGTLRPIPEARHRARAISAEHIPFSLPRIDAHHLQTKAPSAPRRSGDSRASTSMTTSGSSTSGMNHAPRSLRFCLDELGPDRVMFAADHPFEDMAPEAAAFAKADLTDAERAAVSTDNARAIWPSSPLTPDPPRRPLRPKPLPSARKGAAPSATSEARSRMSRRRRQDLLGVQPLLLLAIPTGQPRRIVEHDHAPPDSSASSAGPRHRTSRTPRHRPRGRRSRSGDTAGRGPARRGTRPPRTSGRAGRRARTELPRAVQRRGLQHDRRGRPGAREHRLVDDAAAQRERQRVHQRQRERVPLLAERAAAARNAARRAGAARAGRA